MRGYHIRILVLQDPDIFIPEHLFTRLPAQKPKRRKSTASGPPKKDYRFGPLRIEWMDIEVSTNSARKDTDQGQGPSQATFVLSKHTKTGCTYLPEGIVHVFRDSASILSSEALEATASTSPVSDDADSDGVMLGVLAVPSWMTPSNFLSFVAPASDGMTHIRIVRDTIPNRSIVVVKFSNPAEASDFATAYNGKPFDPMQPEICHVVHVLSVQIQPDDVISQAISRLSISQGPMYELPTCPVCLERMDCAVTGLVTVPCSHTFHCMCLSKWGDSRCPVCRYSQNLLSSHPPSSRSTVPIPFANPSTAPLSTCSSCSSTTNLWICLVCGNIGCGRYGRAHAHAHYQETTHLYALELETQRVWDYAGDGYVHRLIQNKADGKLVELPSAASSTTAGVTDREERLGPSQADALTAEKIEAIGIEYSYLLTSQLESQRSYYEEQMTGQKMQMDELRQMMVSMTRDLENERARRQEEDERQLQEVEARIAQVEREKGKAEKRGEKATQLARKLAGELKDEQAVSQGLMENLAVLREQIKISEGHVQKIKELEEQLRDVMFFLDAKEKIENGDEMAREAAGGSIEVSKSRSGRKKKK